MSLKIGTLAREAGTSIETIRYYERIGLLSQPPRTEGGFRLYGPDDVRRLRFVRRARELGFSLESIRDLLRLASDPVASCDEVGTIARVHLEDVDEKISRLTTLQAELTRLVEHCKSGRMASCGIIEALDEDPPMTK